MTSNSNYMVSTHAHTMEPGAAGRISTGVVGAGLHNANSAASLGTTSYAVPSHDGKPLPAIPKNLALKFKPPTVAVVYLMKDIKSGRMKKYIHEIRIHFEKEREPIDVGRMCEEICRKETMYLNPAFISKQ